MKANVLMQEFKGFALKGNVVDLAIAVVIGTAFGNVVRSLVEKILMPLLNLPLNFIAQRTGDYRSWSPAGIEVGTFLGEVVNFVLIAAALFLIMVKLLGAVKKVVGPPAPGEPTTKECSMCLSVIPIKARKCAHCTADLA